jgi:hypothetical protein
MIESVDKMCQFLLDALPQSKSRKPGVFGTAGRRLAPIQKKVAGRHGTKLRGRQGCQFLLQAVKVAVRVVACLSARCT